MALPDIVTEAFTDGGAPVRAAAYARLQELGIPNRRVEGWRWSDFHAGLRAFAANETGARVIAPSPYAALDATEISIINGAVETPASSAPGLSIDVQAPAAMSAAESSHPFGALTAALAGATVVITVHEGAPTVVIRHVANAARAAGRIAIDVAAGASLILVESYEVAGGFYAASLSIDAAAGASVRRFTLQEADDEAIVHGLAAMRLGDGAHFEQAGVSGGAKLCRHELHVDYAGAGGSARVASAALVGGARHNDVTTLVRHDGEGAVTRQIHKGVASARGRNVFQGKFYVGRGGQRTDAQMTANALLLADGAEANHKPELEIYADDVECAHGSTCGALDDDALFYLRQRGLSETQARALLIEAFVGEVVEGVDVDAVREIFASRVATWMAAL